MNRFVSYFTVARLRIGGIAIALGGFGVNSALAQSPCRYEVTAVVLGPDCGVIGPQSVHFQGLNELGQACGWEGKCAGDGTAGDHLPIVWTPELGKILLPMPEGAVEGEAWDINNVLGSDGFGQVACRIDFGSPIFAERAALYDDGVWTILEPDGGIHTGAFAINDDGWIAGYRDTAFGRMAVRWRGEEIEQIPSPIGGEAIAFDNNETSASTGLFGTSTAVGLGFVWNDVKIVEIPPLPNGTNSEGRSINREGVATGQSRIVLEGGQLTRHSWIFAGSTPVNLGLLPGTINCQAHDLNDANQIVGHCLTPALAPRPFIWQNGTMVLLRDLYDPKFPFQGLAVANAINEQGQIAGRGGVFNHAHAGVILTPIDMTPGDVNRDCKVDADDLMLLLGSWGLCPERGACLADFVTSATFQLPCDGVVDAADLAVLLGNWTLTAPADAANRKR